MTPDCSVSKAQSRDRGCTFIVRHTHLFFVLPSSASQSWNRHLRSHHKQRCHVHCYLLREHAGNCTPRTLQADVHDLQGGVHCFAVLRRTARCELPGDAARDRDGLGLQQLPLLQRQRRYPRLLRQWPGYNWCWRRRRRRRRRWARRTVEAVWWDYRGRPKRRRSCRRSTCTAKGIGIACHRVRVRGIMDVHEPPRAIQPSQTGTIRCIARLSNRPPRAGASRAYSFCTRHIRLLATDVC